MFVEILIGLLFTAFSYMLVPLVFLAVNRGKYEKKKARKIALWNSIIIGAIFCIVTTELSDGETVWSAGPAFLYYFLNVFLLGKKNPSKKNVVFEEEKEGLGTVVYTSINNNDDIVECNEVSVSMGENYIPNEMLSQDVHNSCDKKRKMPLLIIVGVAVILIAFTPIFLKEFKYQTACKKLKKGTYAEALLAFEELEDYRNSEEKLFEAKYQYIINHKQRNDEKTLRYLKELKSENYEDSLQVYEELFGWKMEVIATNSNEDDWETNESLISKYDPVYFHLCLTGGEPNALTRVQVRSKLPNGNESEYLFDNEYGNGEYIWYGWYNGLYEYPEYGAVGTLQCTFYDDNENLIGVASVRIIE